MTASRRERPRPSPLATSAAAWLVVALSAAGCRYQDLGAVGASSAAPFTALECFERDNPEGFSFEVPACSCSAGMRLRYFARLQPSPTDIHLEFETNFLDDDPFDDVRMTSHSADRIECLFIGGRELPAYADGSDGDRVLWDLAQDSWSSMMRNYGPILRRAFRTCAEDRVERESETAVRAASR
jgi:hypothetical protein